MNKLLAWLDDRTGYKTALDHALGEPVRGGASFAYVFGSVLTFILLLQAGTGVILAMHYSPSVSAAWASVAFFQTEVPMGWFIRGLHSRGASAMVIVSGLHLLQVAIYGAYKKPREVNWLLGVMLLGLVLAFALTGYLLPWDQKGYWATKVATGIMGGAPVIGRWLQHVVQGGNEYGNLTLTRFFALHVLVLPAVTALLVVLHVAMFRRHGVTPKWGQSEAELDRKTAPFWPDQLLIDMVAIAACFAAIVFLVIRHHGVPLEAPADPASNYDARPEWYFLPLFELLKHFHGSAEQVIALGLPVVVGAVLLGLPFVDRGGDRSPRARLPYVGVLIMGMAGAAVLIAMAMNADAKDHALQARMKKAEERAAEALKLAKGGVPPAGGTAVWENDPTFKAKRVYAERCAGCHEGSDRKGPLLEVGYNTRAWIQGLLQAPDDARYFGVTKTIHKMKPVKETGAELDEIVEAIYAETGAPDADAAKAAAGRKRIEDGACSDCHTLDPKDLDDGDVNVGPNLGGRGTKAWLVDLMKDPSHPRFFGALNEMPKFVDKLGAEDLDRLAEYVMSLQRNAR